MKIKLKKIINGHYLNVFITRFGLAGVLLVVMIVIYITLRYTSDKTVRNIKEIDSEVVQLKQNLINTNSFIKMLFVCNH